MKKLSILTTIAVFLGFLVIPAWAQDPAVQVQHGPPPALVSPDQSAVMGAVVYPAPPAGFNPAAASVAELEEYGFPPRPDSTAPNYTQWLHMVSMPQSRITNPKLTQLSTTHGSIQAWSIGTPSSSITTSSAPNWSGYVAYNASGIFKANNAAVFSTYVVPVGQQAHNTCDGTQWWSLQWAGFDGTAGTSDVVQAGTGVAATCTTAGTSSYAFAWYEWCCTEPWIAISPPFVDSGDIMSVAVWYTTASPHGHAFLLDETNGQSTAVGFNSASDAPFVGNSVEWIMERPTFSGALPNLENYGQDVFLSNSATLPAGWLPLILAPGLPTPHGITMSAVSMYCDSSSWYPSANCPVATVISTPELYGPFTILFSNSSPSF